ncbi:MBL fold metallo-hydrolase [Glaciibacter superstes]|uniref:MBL fold metallo-hydrolase n=1 Tax=Glaciibacter superstes TaxID=501023 RepID=UPI00041E1AD1|nr:MBL fold metallo-hydrolase [Glaciibacter superstes]
MRDTLITVTGNVQKNAWADRVLPPVECVRDGVWSIPIPFLDNPMRYTLSYLLLGHEGAVLVDPGADSEVGWRHLGAGLRQAGLAVTDLTGIVATHYHSDHLGMAERLRETSGAWLALGEHEVRDVSSDDAIAIAADRNQLAVWGVRGGMLHKLTVTSEKVAGLRGLALPDLRLADGQLLPAPGLCVRVIATPGHSPGHVCLIDEARGLIFSGDHVLPRISPHVTFETPGPANPLADYFASLERIGFEDDMEVCPAHEYRFTGMRRRVKQLVEHNLRRAAEVLEVLDERSPRTVWEIAQHLTWSRGWDSLQALSLRLALSETASHVVYLQSRGYEINVPVGARAPTPVNELAEADRGDLA